MAFQSTFPWSTDGSNALANKANQIIEFYHVSSGESVSFKAFLNQFEDQYSSNWEPHPVLGRMDPLQTFKQTSRQISLAFDVVAGSRDEAVDNLSRISLLMQMLYPEYESGGGATGMKSSPYFKIQFMNFITDVSDGSVGTAETTGLFGTLGGLSFSPDLAQGVFQDDWFMVPGASPGGDYIYPKSVKLSCQITVLHKHQVGWDYNEGFEEALALEDFASFPYLQNTTELSMRELTPLPSPTTEEKQAKKKDPTPPRSVNASAAMTMSEADKVRQREGSGVLMQSQFYKRLREMTPKPSKKRRTQSSLRRRDYMRRIADYDSWE